MVSAARNAAFLAVAKSFSVAIYALLGLVLPHYVKADANGVYSLMTALLFFGSMITTFGIPLVVTRSVARAPERAAEVLAGARAATILGWLLSTLVLAAWLATESWLAGEFEPLRWGLFAMVVAILLSDGLAGVGEAVFQGFERMAAPAAIEIGTGLVRAGGAVLCMVLLPEQLRLQAIFLAFVAGSAGRALMVTRLTRRLQLDPAPAGAGGVRAAVALVRGSVFVALFRMLRMLRNRVDVLLIGVLFVGMVAGAEADPDVARGIYGQAMRVVLIFHVLTQALFTALWPRFARLTEETGREHDIRVEFRRAVRWQAWWAAPLAAGLWLYADVIAGWFGPEYLNGMPEAGVLGTTGGVLRILVVAVFLDCVGGPVGMLMMGSKRLERKMPAFGGALAATSVILNLILIPRFGILGAAWASLGASAVEVIMKAFVLRSVLGNARVMLHAMPYLLLAGAMGAALVGAGLGERIFVGAAAGAVFYIGASLALKLVDPVLLRVAKRALRGR